MKQYKLSVKLTDEDGQTVDSNSYGFHTDKAEIEVWEFFTQLIGAGLANNFDFEGVSEYLADNHQFLNNLISDKKKKVNQNSSEE